MKELTHSVQMRYLDKYLLLDSSEFYLLKKMKSHHKIDFSMYDAEYNWWVVVFKEKLSHISAMCIGKVIGEASKRFKIPANIKYS